jgi:hypothetical protein
MGGVWEVYQTLSLYPQRIAGLRHRKRKLRTGKSDIGPCTSGLLGIEPRSFFIAEKEVTDLNTTTKAAHY